MAVLGVFEEMRDLTGFGADVCNVRQAHLLLRSMDTYVPVSRGDGSSSLESKISNPEVASHRHSKERLLSLNVSEIGVKSWCDSKLTIPMS
jgi:hypothetical protein